MSSFHADDNRTLKSRAEDTKRRIREAEERNAIQRKKQEAER